MRLDHVFYTQNGVHLHYVVNLRVLVWFDSENVHSDFRHIHLWCVHTKLGVKLKLKVTDKAMSHLPQSGAIYFRFIPKEIY